MRCVPPQDVDPDGEEDPFAMVEFVFPINVQHKLKRYLPKLYSS